MLAIRLGLTSQKTTRMFKEIISYQERQFLVNDGNLSVLKSPVSGSNTLPVLSCYMIFHFSAVLTLFSKAVEVTYLSCTSCDFRMIR